MHQTPYDDSYETCERTHAELRIYSGELSPRVVTERLGVEPTVLNEKGKVRVSSTGRERAIPTNLWLLSSEGHVESRDLRRHLDWILEHVSGAADAIRELGNVPGVTLALHCSWWSAHAHGGPALWPEQMRRIADLGVELNFEIMFFGDDRDQ